jgi:glycosyltransferase involved in cell wall biosynthesis
MSDSIRLLALVPYPLDTTPSQRFRIEQWRSNLEQQGISVDLAPFASSGLMKLLHQPGHLAAKTAKFAAAFARRMTRIAASQRYDVVLIHRAACLAGPALVERAIRILGKPVIFDFDDAIYLLHTTDANRRLGWLKFPGKTATLCRIAAHVVVGNAYLADYARQHNPRVTVIPSSVDATWYREPPSKSRDARLVLGWMGSSTSQTHLEGFAPVLQRIGERTRLEFRIVSDRRPVLPGVEHVWRAWSAETEAEELSQFDIGIMPIPDDEWARGKCAMKALLYMSMGVPTICSAVGANREVIQHGKNGFLAATPEEWIARVVELASDHTLRRRLGAEGRLTVEERYSMNGCANMFAEVVREVIQRHGAVPDTLRGVKKSVDRIGEADSPT